MDYLWNFLGKIFAVPGRSKVSAFSNLTAEEAWNIQIAVIVSSGGGVNC